MTSILLLVLLTGLINNGAVQAKHKAIKIQKVKAEKAQQQRKNPPKKTSQQVTKEKLAEQAELVEISSDSQLTPQSSQQQNKAKKPIQDKKIP